jgi:hypothetical protein
MKDNAQSQLLESERVKEKFETSNQICGITKVVCYIQKPYLTVREFCFIKLPLCFNLYYDRLLLLISRYCLAEQHYKIINLLLFLITIRKLIKNCWFV